MVIMTAPNEKSLEVTRLDNILLFSRLFLLPRTLAQFVDFTLQNCNMKMVVDLHYDRH